MPKFARYFLTSALFVFGISLGSYLAILNEQPINNVNEVEENNGNDKIIPIQDVVIRNVQEENSVDKNVIETVVDKVKLSPYAKMIIEKKFTRCGHTSIETIDIPSDLINMTEEEVQAKYENWEIKSFSTKSVSLYREIVANCNDHFVLKDKDGFLAIYEDVTENDMNLKEITDIDISTLPSGDIANLKNGILVYGKDELSGLLEDFGS